MLRFPNPGSDIDGFIRIYQELFDALSDQVTFDLDDMSRILVDRNLATSSGYMGEEALVRSFNQDRSRDRLYNQSKMYSELYKVLGWIHPSQSSALNFQFTYLGAHVAAARHEPTAIFKESILGIVYPNQVLDVKGKYRIRPFVTILRTLVALEGLLCRDEMIVGPLCLEDDRDESKFNAMIADIKLIRVSWTRLEDKINVISRERAITPTTMGNYTRFPLAVMKWTGWTDSQKRRDYYGRSIPFLVLTGEGRKLVEEVLSWRDIRNTDLASIDATTKDALVRFSFYQMLRRVGFEVETVQNLIEEDRAKIETLSGNPPAEILFSPFQEMTPAYVNSLFPKVTGLKEAERTRLSTSGRSFVLPRLVTEVSLSSVGPSKRISEERVFQLFQRTEQSGLSPEQIIDFNMENYRSANKEVFYPLVAQLFSALGYNCEYSRPGVNYQRWDAVIIDPVFSIPIEIKSPGEEEFLSVKAIRQALENKIIMLSRKSFPTQPQTTSLVVGYKLPNDRSEVVSLISDIHKAFGIVIGVLDFRSLLQIAVATMLQGKTHNPDNLRDLHGIIKVKDS